MRPRLLGLLTLALLFFGLPSLTSVLVDWLWFGEVGYQSVYLTTLVRQVDGRRGGVRPRLPLDGGTPAARVECGERGAGVVHDAGGIHHRAADARSAPPAGDAGGGGGGRTARRVRGVGVAHGAVAGGIGRDFPASDPILGRNVALLRLYAAAPRAGPRLRPGAHRARRDWLGRHLRLRGRARADTVRPADGARRSTPRRRARRGLVPRASRSARGSISRVSWSSPSGIIHGASYTDVHARIPAALALAAASLVGAVLSLLYAAGRAPWGLAARGGLYAIVLAGGSVYASFLQRFAVTPNELARETPYIVHNIEATRQGFALDRVEERELSGDAELTRADIDRNRETIDNVRLWDHQPLLQTFGQIQEIRTYYDFIVGRQRPLRHQRPHAAGDALGARAESRGAPEPHVDQRAARLHARLRRDARAGQPGRPPKGCRCCSFATCRRCRPSTCR